MKTIGYFRNIVPFTFKLTKRNELEDMALFEKSTENYKGLLAAKSSSKFTRKQSPQYITRSDLRAQHNLENANMPRRRHTAVIETAVLGEENSR